MRERDKGQRLKARPQLGKNWRASWGWGAQMTAALGAELLQDMKERWGWDSLPVSGAGEIHTGARRRGRRGPGPQRRAADGSDIRAPALRLGAGRRSERAWGDCARLRQRWHRGDVKVDHNVPSVQAWHSWPRTRSGPRRAAPLAPPVPTAVQQECHQLQRPG